jgi:hypothetical protein
LARTDSSPSQGWVANDVESEQIVSEELVTPFHVAVPSSRRAPSSASDRPPKRAMSPRYTSFVQIRGSIPFYWNQDLTKGTIKPDFLVAPPDPYYSAGARHFDQLFRDYGGHVIAINLIKVRYCLLLLLYHPLTRFSHLQQTDNRESNLLSHFRECVGYLNKFLPDENKIDYIEYDHSFLKKRFVLSLSPFRREELRDLPCSP